MRNRTSARRKSIVLAIGLVGGLAGLVASATPVAASPAVLGIKTVISGLNTPRGITFDGSGAMYVAQSGVAGSGAFGLTRTGKVTKYRRGSTSPAWTTSFESVFATEDPTQPPDVLGPEGLSATRSDCGRSGEHRGEDANRGACAVRLIMSVSHDGISAASGGAVNTKDAGHLFALNPRTGRATDKSDFGDQQYQFTTTHQALFPSDFPDSNPYGVLVTGGRAEHSVRTFVADAGANTVSEVMPGGRARVIAYIPNETAAPFRDATPTCIAQGPDGMLYVATLHFVANLFVFGSGRSDVWRVDPNANYPTAPKLWATGLTTPTACTFDRKGNFWAAEMFQPTSGTPGDVVRIPFKHPTRLTRIGGGQLPLPGGIAQGPNGDMYVTTNSSSPTPGSGAVVRIED
jgi:hypothetical protein